MPLFKVWNISRTKKKAVVAEDVEDLIRKGKEKLGILDGECYIFDESDGTEVEDDESLLSYDRGTVFIIGKEWREVSSRSDLAKKVSVKEREQVANKEMETSIANKEAKPQEKKEDVPESMDIPIEKCSADKEARVQNKEEDEHDSILSPTVDGDGCKSSESAKMKEEHYEQQTDGSFETASDQDELPTHSRYHQEPVEKTTFTDVLNKVQFKYAKMKNFKIYSEKEIDDAKSDLEKKRRRFWNEKAEQLASSTKTSKCDKTTIAGIIDVSWTLRKTSFIEGDAKKILEDANILFEKHDSSGKLHKLGQQKRETLPKKLERMAAAHLAVENMDSEIQNCQTKFKAAKTQKERKVYNEEYKRKKTVLDSAYTELKRAQEATAKSIKVKRQQITSYLESVSTMEDSD